jgi:hypothetical protein
MLDLMKSKRVWAAASFATAIGLIPFLVFGYFQYRGALGRLTYEYFKRFDLPIALAIIISGLILWAFFVVYICISAARRHHIDEFSVSKFGVACSLKSLTCFSLLPFLLTSTGFFDFFIVPDLVFRAFISATLLLLWIWFDKRTPTRLRLLCLIGLAGLAVWCSWSFYQDLPSERDGPINGKSFASFDIGQSEIDFYTEAKIQVSGVSVVLASLFGAVVGHLCKPLIATPRPEIEDQNTGYQRNQFSQIKPKLTTMQYLGGSLAGLAMIGAVTSRSTPVYRLGNDLSRIAWDPHWDWSLRHDGNILELLLSRFDEAALNSGSQGIFSIAPFFGGDLVILWLASRFQVRGLIPVLVIGAAMGLLWSLSTTSFYVTPFMNFNGAATLLGMIVAAAFGAGTNLFAVPRGANSDEALDKMVTQAK